MRTFDLETVLSITTGVMLVNIDGIYDILNYMTGDNLLTHQLGKAADACVPTILEQHPELAAVGASNVDCDNWQAFAKEQVAAFGETREIAPLSNWTPSDPLQSLVDMVGAERVVIAQL